MLKLGYDPNLVQLKPPTLDNSQIIKREIPKPSYDNKTSFVKHEPAPNFKPPEILNIDEWSDFDSD